MALSFQGYSKDSNCWGRYGFVYSIANYCNKASYINTGENGPRKRGRENTAAYHRPITLKSIIDNHPDMLKLGIPFKPAKTLVDHLVW
jgi:hypothetical protein